MDIAETYKSMGHSDKVFISGETGQILGLGDAESKNWALVKLVALKKKDGTRYTISQILRLKDDDEYSDTFGEERLVIQLLMHYKDFHDNLLTVTYEVGRTSQPVFKTRTSAFDPETGAATEKITTLEGFKQVLSIPFSENLVRTLAPICRAKCSLIIHTGAQVYG